MTIDGRRLVAWSDLDERRRRGGRAARVWWFALGLGVALAAIAGHRAHWHAVAPSPTYLIAIALVGFVPIMFLAPHQLFWRADAAMVARLPIAGAALWQAAVIRAARSAALALLIVGPTLGVAVVGDLGVAARALALVAALALATVLLVPAVCVGAAHVVASGQAAAASRALAGGDAVATTSLLGAVPGATIAAVVVAAALCHRWLGDGGDAQGWIVVAALAGAAIAAGAAATALAPEVLPRAMREVAALDRQILAHLEIHRVTWLEARVRDRLDRDSGLVFDRMARLIRRRYPLFALGGAAGAIALCGLGWGRPDGADGWLAVAAAVEAWIAISVALATGAPPVELARATALLPVTPAAVARARRAIVGTWLAVWAVVPIAVAVARSPAPATTAGQLAIGVAIGLGVGWARRRRDGE